MTLAFQSIISNRPTYNASPVDLCLLSSKLTTQPYHKWQPAASSPIRQQNICNANEFTTLQQCQVSQDRNNFFPMHQHPWSVFPVLWSAVREPVRPATVMFWPVWLPRSMPLLQGMQFWTFCAVTVIFFLKISILPFLLWCRAVKYVLSLVCCIIYNTSCKKLVW